MDKSQPLFPFSPSLSSNSNTISSSTTNPHVLSNFLADDPRGFLGLSTDNQMVHTTSTGLNKDTSSSLSMNFARGSECELKPVTKKKGEKKVKKPKYAFQTRSQVDILDDGYRWRKYGQKAVKHNKFPRSYYRCTHQGCNVKKQVQRLTRDEGVVVTTYEGMHTHPIDKPTDNFEHILTQMQIYSIPSQTYNLI